MLIQSSLILLLFKTPQASIQVMFPIAQIKCRKTSLPFSHNPWLFWTEALVWKPLAFKDEESPPHSFPWIWNIHLPSIYPLYSQLWKKSILFLICFSYTREQILASKLIGPNEYGTDQRKKHPPTHKLKVRSHLLVSWVKKVPWSRSMKSLLGWCPLSFPLKLLQTAASGLLVTLVLTHPLAGEWFHFLLCIYFPSVLLSLSSGLYLHVDTQLLTHSEAAATLSLGLDCCSWLGP